MKKTNGKNTRTNSPINRHFYEKPEYEIISFNYEDIITESGKCSVDDPYHKYDSNITVNGNGIFYV